MGKARDARPLVVLTKTIEMSCSKKFSGVNQFSLQESLSVEYTGGLFTSLTDSFAP